MILALLAGLIGARFVHVLANGAYYAERPQEIVLPLDGGLSLHGGLVAGLGMVALLALVGSPGHPGSVRRLLIVAAALVIPVSMGLLGGWLACLLRGCAYGVRFRRLSVFTRRTGQIWSASMPSGCRARR